MLERAVAWRTWILAFAVAVFAFAGIEGVHAFEGIAGGMQEVDVEAQGGMSGGTIVALVLLLLLVLGSPVFLIIGALAVLCFMLFGDGYDNLGAFEVFPAKIGNLTTKNVLLAIPFFVISGSIMSAGDIANRLVAFARAAFAFLPGGLAIATVGGCMFFAAISGSSPVTVIAIGTVMYPALLKAGYGEAFSLGLVTSGGSLGILIPPSIPMLIYAIVAGGRNPIDVGELFLAGVLPGVLIAILLSIYGMFVASRMPQQREPFRWSEVALRFREGFWAIMLPVLILGGIYSGLFTATEAAAISVIYALVVELYVHRQLGVRDLPRILAESAVMMGTLLIIMALAFGLNDFLVEEKVPDAAVEWIQAMDLSLVGFLLLVNLLLLVVGALMDSVSAIMIIAPLLVPVAEQLGVDPIHLGIIFIVNLEIGYLTPPIGLNLFVSSTVFEKPIGFVMKSVVPFIGMMLVGLVLVTYVPSIALGPVNVLLRDKSFVQPLEPREVPVNTAPSTPGAPATAGEAAGGKVLSVEEMMKIAGEIDTQGEDAKAEPFAGGKVLSLQEMMDIAEMADATDGGGERSPKHEDAAGGDADEEPAATRTTAAKESAQTE